MVVWREIFWSYGGKIFGSMAGNFLVVWRGIIGVYWLDLLSGFIVVYRRLLPLGGGGSGGDEGFFGVGGDDLHMDVVLAGEEETLADWEVREALLLFFG